MNNRPIDKTKKANIKCEHCQFWCEWGIEGKCKDNYCMNPYSEHYHHQRKYWNRCKQFKWPEGEKNECSK